MNPEKPIPSDLGLILLPSIFHSLSISSEVFRNRNLSLFLTSLTKSAVWGIEVEYETKKPPIFRAVSACFITFHGSGRSKVINQYFLL